MKNLTGLRIRTRDGSLISIENQYKTKNNYHRMSAKRSFEEKIKELLSMQKIVNAVKQSTPFGNDLHKCK